MMLNGVLPIANHLWQSTLFAGIAGLLTLLLRKNRAHARYCLWLGASAKFLVPFSLLVLVGGRVGRHSVVVSAYARVPIIVEQVNEPFVAAVPLGAVAMPHASKSGSWVVPMLTALWATGCGALVFSWWLRWRRMQAVLRAASPLALTVGVPVFSSASVIEPGVLGVFRPILLLPDGIRDELTPAELQAILAHELCHVRRRDNLATVMHMIVEALFWFHPLVWWLGARLMEERERACDEEVLRTGNQPEAYAEGILKICELYLQSPLQCLTGVTGANLKKRIEAIMENRSSLSLGFAKKAGLAIAGVIAVAIPVILGVTNAPMLRAQADPNLRFEVASIRRVEVPNNGTRVPAFLPTGGVGTSDPTRIAWHGLWLMNLISEAFGVQAEHIIGLGPVAMERYDFVANIPEGATKEQYAVMLANLLRDRFHLRFHMESKVMPVYALRVGKNGPKFKESDPARRSDTKKSPGGIDEQGYPIPPRDFSGIISLPHDGQIFIVGQDVPIADLARLLQHPQGMVRPEDRPVIDETGLKGHYDFKLHHEYIRRPPAAGEPGVAPDPAPSALDAAEKQLGLKLESSTAPIPQLIIDSIDRDPTEN
jgi:bla regulator protein blaR1